MTVLEENLFKKLRFEPYLWTNDLHKLKELFNFLNEFHPSNKFIIDHSKNSINLLDVKVSKSESENTLCTSLFTKPTDTHQYPHATSCHRSIYKRSIPYGQAVRIKRIQRNLNDLESWLIDS